MHVDVAADCVEAGVHLATASYVSPGMEALHAGAVRRSVVLLNECGLDPGLDHMSAMALLDSLKNKGADITSFISYTGGLVAPESNDNPWGYKFSWNPRNVILAGQGTARYIENGAYKYVPYHRLFAEAVSVDVNDEGMHMEFDGYANRDSLAYRKTYGLEKVPTLLRGTLRQKNFCKAWQVFVELGMTDDTYVLENSERLSCAEWVHSCIPGRVPGATASARLAAYLRLDPSGEVFHMIEWTGILSDAPLGLTGATPAQALQHLLEKKWVLKPTDRDMIVMQHQVRYREGASANTFEIRSSLVVKGTDARQTAMAKTVGLPLALAAHRLLDGKIKQRGCVVPVFPEIYEPVLSALKTYGIVFHETHRAVSMSL
jgi:saccharopine dehydrogenase-like NADP-dependent oxidoreductase